MNKEELWQAVLAQVQLNISSANFATWFKNTEIANHKKGVVFISVPNFFVKEWLEQKYHKMLFKILRSLKPDIKEIKYVVGRQQPSINQKKKTVFIPEEQLKFNEFNINKETGLNPKYSFENFVVGPFNELPHAAAQAVTKNPGNVYNPLFIYGGVGLGKTHLLQAVGNTVIKKFKKKKVKYLSTEKFTSDVIEAIKNQKMEFLKNQYQEIDVLIIDDIHFLAGREKTQDVFFHLFNSLYQKNKQIVISSDRPPKIIPSLTERLRSRFEGGMIADIGTPDFETRVAILKAKAKEKMVNFSDEVYNYIALNIQKNVRELEGALNRLIAHQGLNTKDFNIEEIKKLLKNVIFSPPKIATPRKIIKAVAEFYELKEKDLLAPSRKKEIVYPRQIAMFLLRKELKSSYPFIGRRFKGKDHTTAIHACEKISREIEYNEKLVEEINLIKQKIYEI